MDSNKCPQCGTEIVDKTKKYCDNCGFDLLNVDEKEMVEEREFVEGFSRNYPYLWNFSLALCFFLGCFGVGFINKGHPFIGKIMLGVAIFLGIMFPILLILIRKNVMGKPSKKEK